MQSQQSGAMPSQELEQAQSALQRSVEGLIERFSTRSLSVQKKSVQCSLNCFDKYPTSAKNVGNCIQSCQKPFEELSKITNKEFSQLQGGVQTCQKSCMDKLMPQLEAVRSGLAPALTPTEETKLQGEMEQCSVRCLKEGLPKVAEMEKRLEGYVVRMEGSTGWGA